MAQLILRDIDEAVVRALEVRAAARGVSAEAEHRAILRDVLSKKRKGGTLKSALVSMSDVGEGEDLVFERDADRPNGLPG
jgi:plasmid stability protein